MVNLVLVGTSNSFLSGRTVQARDLILRTPLDGGVACESIDQHTGIARTGQHFATCDGFLAYAIHWAYGKRVIPQIEKRVEEKEIFLKN
jgi:uncharacterized protein